MTSSFYVGGGGGNDGNIGSTLQKNPGLESKVAFEEPLQTGGYVNYEKVDYKNGKKIVASMNTEDNSPEISCIDVNDDQIPDTISVVYPFGLKMVSEKTGKILDEVETTSISIKEKIKVNESRPVLDYYKTSMCMDCGILGSEKSQYTTYFSDQEYYDVNLKSDSVPSGFMYRIDDLAKGCSQMLSGGYKKGAVMDETIREEYGATNQIIISNESSLLYDYDFSMESIETRIPNNFENGTMPRGKLMYILSKFQN